MFFDVALGGLDERTLLHDILFAFQGIDGQFLKWNAVLDRFTIDDRVRAGLFDLILQETNKKLNLFSYPPPPTAGHRTANSRTHSEAR